MTVSTAFPPGQRARGVAIETEYVNLGAAGTKFRPVRIGVFGLGAVANEPYSTDKEQVYTAAYVGNKWGYDSELYQELLSLFPVNGDGVGNIPVTVYPLAQPASGGVQATGDITPVGTQTKQQSYWIKVNNILSDEIVMAIGDTVADFIAAGVTAVNAVLSMPGTASDGTTKLDFEVGWEGATGNSVYLEVIGPDDAEMTFASITQPTGGAGTVSITDALAQIGDVWETHIVNSLQYTDSTILNEFSTFGEGRWDPQVRKPLKVYTGTSEATLATVTAVTDARKTDRTNIIIPSPATTTGALKMNDLPCVIAADAVRRIAPLANTIPPHDYGGLECSRLTQGLDSVQWNSSQRDTAVKAGLSTIEVKDGKVTLSDIVTCYHPTGEDPPAYSHDVDLEKIATMIFNFNAEFDSSKWNGAPLVPDGQAVRERTAKKPKDARSAMGLIFDNAALDAIISDPDYAKTNSTADISGTNPKRLDIVAVFKLAGNVNVLPITLQFGFYYGG